MSDSTTPQLPLEVWLVINQLDGSDADTARLYASRELWADGGAQSVFGLNTLQRSTRLVDESGDAVELRLPLEADSSDGSTARQHLLLTRDTFVLDWQNIGQMISSLLAAWYGQASEITLVYFRSPQDRSSDRVVVTLIVSEQQAAWLHESIAFGG